MCPRLELFGALLHGYLYSRTLAEGAFSGWGTLGSGGRGKKTWWNSESLCLEVMPITSAHISLVKTSHMVTQEFNRAVAYNLLIGRGSAGS